MRRTLSVLALALSLLSGCVTRPVAGPAADNVLILNKNIAWGELFWRTEIKSGLPRNSPEPYLVICHGGDNKQGVWCLWPDNSAGDGIPVTPFVDALRRTRPPHQPIFLLVCNKQGRSLNVPGVYYMKSVVCAAPYTAYAVGRDTADRFGQFVTDPPTLPGVSASR